MRYLVIFFIFLLSGCASPAAVRNAPVADIQQETKNALTDLSGVPSVVKVTLPPGALVVQDKSFSIPPENDKIITADFNGASVESVLYSVGRSSKLNIIHQQAPVSSVSVSAPSGSGSPVPVSSPVLSGASRPVSLTFKGRLSDFLDVLSSSTGYIFDYRAGSVVARDRSSFNVVVPNYPDLLKQIKESVVALGGSEVSYDPVTSSLSFSSDAIALRKIRDFCDNIRRNASLVTLRIMLVNVHLEESQASGIDWTQLAVGWKSQRAALPFGQNQGATTTAAGTTTVQPQQLFNQGAAAVFSASGANAYLEASDFSMSLLLGFLEKYGTYRMLQNAFVEAMSGSKGSLSVTTETPYVSKVSVTALSTQSSTPTQGMETATAKTGIELSVIPSYSRFDGSLTISLKASVSAVTRMLSLTAGSSLGTITQPETTSKNVDTFLRMSPAQVAVIGGLVYNQTSSGIAGLPGDTLLTKNTTKSSSRDELVILVKPTVIEFVTAAGAGLPPMAAAGTPAGEPPKR